MRSPADSRSRRRSAFVIGAFVAMMALPPAAFGVAVVAAVAFGAWQLARARPDRAAGYRESAARAIAAHGSASASGHGRSVLGRGWPLGRIARVRREAATWAGSPVPLGVDHHGAVVVLTDEQLAAHGLIAGASGSGKSTTLARILCDRIARGVPVVAIDLKGSPGFARQLADAAARAGRPFALWTPDGPVRWNPLARGNPTELKDKLIATERFTEPHYKRAAERYLQLALQVLEEARPGSERSLEEVVAMLDPARLRSVAQALPEPRRAAIIDYLDTLGRDVESAVRGLANRLAVIAESHAGRWLGEAIPGSPRLDLDAALAADGVVVFSLNSSSYGELAAQLGTLAVQDLVSVAGRRLAAGGPATALVAVDEFSALGGDQVEALFARAREAGIGVLVATQELADLDRAAPGLRDQVLGNTAVKLIHRQEVPSSAQTIAQIAGTEMRWEVTERLAPFGLWLWGRPPQSPGTRREVERFVVHPNQIKRLERGEVVIITKIPRAEVRTLRVLPPRTGELGSERG